MHGTPHLLRRKVHIFDPLNEAHLSPQSNGFDEWTRSVRPACRIEQPLLATSERTIEAPLEVWLSIGWRGEDCKGEENGQSVAHRLEASSANVRFPPHCGRHGVAEWQKTAFGRNKPPAGAPMSTITSHSRRYSIAVAAVLAVGAGVLGLVRYYPALGPIAGTITPQLYVDLITDGEIPAKGRYVLVDAGSARLFMIEDGRVRDSMRVIVGKPETPTPALKSVINYETLNPYWHVTADLAKTLIAPRVLQDGTAYLTTRGYEVVSAFGPNAQVLSPDSVDWKAVADGTAQVLVRQRPGPANSLGQVKFDLPDGDGIYLHDTPKKELFALDARNLSHGCVRLEDAPKLARWLLGRDPPAVTKAEEHILLPRPVPITISYLGARAQMQLAGLQ